LSITAIVFGFALGYAVLRGDHWFGGLSWPPRFLIPIIPFLMLGTLPIFDRVLRSVTRWWLVAGVSLVGIYSLWTQLSAVSYDWGVYISLLPPEANGLGEWGGGLNVVRYLRWVLIPTAWGHTPPDFDFAWVRAGDSAWPIVCCIVVVICAVWIYRLLCKPHQQIQGFSVRGRCSICFNQLDCTYWARAGSVNDDVLI
jgi:hypothetical protein